MWGNNKVTDRGPGCLWLLQVVAKPRNVGHVSTVTEPEKSSCVQIGAAAVSVFSLHFSPMEQTFVGCRRKESL